MSEEMPEPQDRVARPRRRPRRPRGVGVPADPAAWRTTGVVAGIAALLVVGGLFVPAPSADDDPAGAVEPVDSSLAICPEPGSVDGGRTTSAITVVPDLPGQEREGEASIALLRGAAAADDSPAADVVVAGDLVSPGDAAEVVAEQTRLPALEVRTQGGLAPGLVASQVTQDSFSASRGLASQPCLGPDTTWWFVGGGSTAGRDSDLVLVNPEETPADVEVSISGPDGVVTTPQLRGLVVEPRSRIVVKLSREAPRLPAAAWRVTVRQGRVVAALSDKQTEGFVPQGADWIPASADPSTRVLIPGVIGGPGGRQLLVHAPGDLAATVRVRLITTGGSFVPQAASEVEVPAGAVVAVDLDEALQGEDATVDLQSDVPIVAGVRQRHPGLDATKGSLEETSFTAGAVPIVDVAAVTGLQAARGTSVTVWVTVPDEIITIESAADMPGMDAEMSASPDAMADDTPTDAVTPPADDTASKAVSVTLRVLPAAPGEPTPPMPDPITLSVAPGRLVAVTIPRPAGASWLTVVAEVSGGEAVIAHRLLRRNEDGSLVTGYPWLPLRTTVVVPRAVPDPGLAVPGE